MSQQPIFRFAPSPNGLLHLGHAYSALLNQKMANARDGKLLLRIEDIDTARSKPKLINAIYDDLAWLGISFARDIRQQSDHFDLYAQAAEKLNAQGLLYPCFCTRKTLAENADGQTDPDGAPLYTGTCKHLSGEEVTRRIAWGASHCWRLDSDAAKTLTGPLTWQELVQETASDSSDICTTTEVNIAQWGDIILVRKDTPTSYHLAVTLCDAAQRVSHVVRGHDLYHATSIHRTLQKLLELPAPIYFHHMLVTDDSLKKLSKSAGSTSLQSLREQGWTRSDIINELHDGLV